MFSRDNTKLSLVAAFCLTVGLAGPSVAGAVQKGLNADQVDGKHAVGAKAPVAKRKNKLVATNKQGYLPDNIVRGQAALRTVVIPANAMGGTNLNQLFGASLRDDELDTVVLGLTLPASYRTGSVVSVDVSYQHITGACTVALSTLADRASVRNALTGPLSALLPNGLTGQNLVLPARVGKVTLRIPTAPLQPLGPGDSLRVRLLRSGSAGADVCASDLFIMGAVVHF